MSPLDENSDNPRRIEEVDNDELYNLVQSAISEIDTARSGAVKRKLQQLGINFDFLRESYESHRASVSHTASLSQRAENATGGGEGISGEL